MNLRDKIRAVGGTSAAGRSGQAAPADPGPRDCVHFTVRRPAEEFAGAWELSRETLGLMSSLELPERLDPRKILYLDTETTGLGGSGTVAFLVGMGYLTDEGFEVHQFLMRDYPEETAVLRHMAAGLDRFDMLCTFNGSTFDLPLLESRLLMNRMDRHCLEKPHLDLLHMCRRLWRLRLGRCNLGRLEEVILGRPREEDLPGSQVPERYFRFLKSGDMRLLEDILKHNAQDIASLCVLLNHMADLYLHPERIRFSEDVYSMGRALEKNDRQENARECYRLASRGRMGAQAEAALAVSYRREGRKAEAAGTWQRMISAGLGGPDPYVELAKYYEHTLRDYRAALSLTEKALTLLSEPSLRPDAAVQEQKNAVQYRYQRLIRKLEEEKNGTDDRNQGKQGLSAAAEGGDRGGDPPV